MNPNFPTWYREVNLTPTEEMLKKRWTAVEAIVKKADVGLIEELIRYFITRGKLGQCAPKLNAAFQKADQMFELKNNEKELVVLTGTILVRIVESRADLAAIVCLGVKCYRYYVSLDGHPLGEVVSVLERKYRELAASVRAYQNKLHPIKALSLKAAIDALQAAAGDPTLPKVIEAEIKAHTSIQTAWQAMSQAWNESLMNPLIILSEETELLWVLQCGYVDAVDMPVQKLNAAKACLLLAEQLANATKLVPGPLSIGAIFEALIQKSADKGAQPITILAAITSANSDWKGERPAPHASKLAPLPTLIAKAAESAPGMPLTELGKGIVDGDHYTKDNRVVDISIQYYHELLLLRILSPLPG